MLARTGSGSAVTNMKIPTAVVLKQNDFSIIFSPVLDVYRAASLVVSHRVPAVNIKVYMNLFRVDLKYLKKDLE